MASTVLATRDASPRMVARYLAALKPILGSAADARNEWVRYLGELARKEDVAAAHSEAVQFALARGEQFHAARQAIARLIPPPGYEPMHLSVDAWLAGLLGSCEVLVRAAPPLGQATLDRLQEILREAGVKADKFNTQRTIAVQAIRDAQAPVPQRVKGIIANRKEMRALVIALVAALLLVGGAGYALSSLADAAPPTVRTPTAAAKPGNAGAGGERRVFPQPEILARLKQEVASRQVAWQDLDIRLVAPDRVIVTGKIQGPTGLIPVEVELQMSVTGDGRPQLTATRLSAIGVEVPAGAFDALTKRIDEANKTLPEQMTPGQAIKRLFVEGNSVVAEMVSAAPAAGAAPAKPGP